MTREEELLALLPELSAAEKERRTREGLADVDAGAGITAFDTAEILDNQ